MICNYTFQKLLVRKEIEAKTEEPRILYILRNFSLVCNTNLWIPLVLKEIEAKTEEPRILYIFSNFL